MYNHMSETISESEHCANACGNNNKRIREHPYIPFDMSRENVIASFWIMAVISPVMISVRHQKDIWNILWKYLWFLLKRSNRMFVFIFTRWNQIFCLSLRHTILVFKSYNTSNTVCVSHIAYEIMEFNICWIVNSKLSHGLLNSKSSNVGIQKRLSHWNVDFPCRINTTETRNV